MSARTINGVDEMKALVGEHLGYSPYVEITQELVNLIVAQRNFQANAQVISTEDQVTQAVINLR